MRRVAAKPTLLDLCAELLHTVMRFDAPADSVVSNFFKAHRGLGQRERHTLAETTYQVLRQRLLLQHFAQSGSGSPERRLAIVGWQGDAEVLTKLLEPHELAWLARCHAVDRSTLPDKFRHNLPDWLAGALRGELDDAAFDALGSALNTAAPLDLRVNTHKARREAVMRSLHDAGIDCAETPHSPWGLRVPGKPALTKLEVFQRGDIEVQDEGSQLLVLLTDAKRGEMVVDFCAGAGGKTLALGAAMRNTGRLYAYDTSGHRLAAMKPRLARSGLSNVHPAQLAHERDERIKRLAGKIDRVLIDAPCSGLGTLRRNPDLKWRQSPKSIAELQLKQQAILDSAARLLKPGGRLVYATCSLLRAENEFIAQAFDAGHGGEFERLDVAPLLQQAQVARAESLCRAGYLRLWPHVHGTDGFFAAVWQRR